MSLGNVNNYQFKDLIKKLRVFQKCISVIVVSKTNNNKSVLIQ